MAMQDFRYARYTARNTNRRGTTPGTKGDAKRAYTRDSRNTKCGSEGEPITPLSLRRINSCEYRVTAVDIVRYPPIRDQKVRIEYIGRYRVAVATFFYGFFRGELASTVVHGLGYLRLS